MKLKVVFALLLFTSLSQAQTKIIAHKSHSGSNSSFAKAYKNNLFDISRSNFGIANTYIRRLDTIIAVNNSITIVKYRQSKEKYEPGAQFRDLKKIDFTHLTDTLINDPILNKKNTVKFIKSSKKILYNTPTNEVVFIGFKNK
ncbi:hypothetical protein [Flavobacterium sp. ov086]|uniref:hypothetical protein n=1 Tax=Flavobacterium sp. ov086 TaxID=1761785 RepID=UPI000B6428AC|nr:hypothetical protein [Flavobacterium sp. ov086]SNR40233.1 hypothetical protein SAMN04487979_10524 [Flavobacterium sp. ov086]